LEQLAQACEPASFGKDHEDAFDETYRKAEKMDSECFSPMLDLCHTDVMKIIRGYLLEGTQSTKNIKTEIYKLNVYGTLNLHSPHSSLTLFCPGRGSFFKPHVDTPRSEKMFGSLVIVFPSPHEGGALLLRHRGHEWIFDSGQALAANRDKGQPSIGYVAFFSDIEHEVAPVTSGHRITLTYNLYFDDGGPVSANDAVPERLNTPKLANESAFRETFTALLENPEFLADGGGLAFGLRHVYPINDDITHVYSVLKGSDAVVYQTVRALGYEPVLYVYYEETQREGMIIDNVISFEHAGEEDFTADIVYRAGGILVTQGGEKAPMNDHGQYGTPEQVEWVTPVTEFNCQKDAFATLYGNEPCLSWAYGNECLVVRIGKAGDRLAYPTVAELNKAYEKRLEGPQEDVFL
jgi:2OG-Fe(II) oxygenase superfamily